ncbi:hypothetical protein E2C01_029661 [Portunus trituberculatus]|uniref:Uncharacterized protein n=1 Tax=Portunus trituberculatus TaxID=210409 RepID=A0A5B7EPX8_PORTR|nr:hypothetical protein [Portunus trituberculatus]
MNYHISPAPTLHHVTTVLSSCPGHSRSRHTCSHSVTARHGAFCHWQLSLPQLKNTVHLMTTVL